MFGRKAREIERLRKERDQAWEQRNEAMAELDETRGDRDELNQLCSVYFDRIQRLHEAYKHLQQRLLALHPEPDPITYRPYLLEPPMAEWEREMLGGGS